MKREVLNAEVCCKIHKEFEEFETWLLKQPADEILKRADEYAVKKNICDYISAHDVRTKYAKALAESEHPLEDTFIEYSKRPTNRMYDVEMSVEIAANKIAISVCK